MTTAGSLEWEDQANGANNNTWGDVADANFAIFDTAIADYLAVATTGGSTTLTSAQNRAPIIKITGILVSNATIVVKTLEKNWRFYNATSGAYTVTVKTTAGTGQVIPRGAAVLLYCDGTNVENLRMMNIPTSQAGGSANALTATFYPPITTVDLEDSLIVIVEAGLANTSGTVTFNPDSLGALNITRRGGEALAVGDIVAAGHKLLLAYDKSSTRWELLNPAGLATTSGPGIVELATGAETLALTSTALAITPSALAAFLARGTNITGDTTITVGDGGFFRVLGTSFTTTAITLTTATQGRCVALYFTQAGGIITHNATTLPLPGGQNITIAAGDILLVWQNDANIRTAFFRYDGQAVAGGWEKVATLTPAGAATAPQTGLSAYQALRITLIGVTPSTDGTQLKLQLNSGSYLSTDYEGRVTSINTSGSTDLAVGGDGFLNASTQTIGKEVGDGGVSGQILITDFNTAQKTRIFSDLIFGKTDGTFRAEKAVIWHTGQTAMQAIRLLFEAGNITGTIVIEGMK